MALVAITSHIMTSPGYVLMLVSWQRFADTSNTFLIILFGGLLTTATADR